MKILALDLSSKCSGYAIVDNRRLIKWGCLKATQSDPIARIKSITKQLDEVLTEHPNIYVVVMEEVRPESGQDAQFQRNQHTQKILMYVQAAVVFLVHEHAPSSKTEFYYPSEWRKINGIAQGRGIKREEQKVNDINFVKTLFQIDVNDDEADAIGIGVAYANMHDKKRES